MKEKTRSKRLLSILLACLMLLSLIPTTAFASVAQHKLTVTVDGGSGGTVSVAGAEGTTHLETSIDDGEILTFTFIPAEAGYVVDSVTVDGDDVTATVTDNTLVLTMDDDHTVVVKFFQKWGLDGVAHWLMGTENEPENHVDQDGDGICDICCYNMPSDGENDEPGTDNPEDGDPNPNAPGGGEVDDSNPKTGDNRATVLWIALLAASGFAGVLTLRRRSAKF